MAHEQINDISISLLKIINHGLKVYQIFIKGPLFPNATRFMIAAEIVMVKVSIMIKMKLRQQRGKKTPKKHCQTYRKSNRNESKGNRAASCF